MQNFLINYELHGEEVTPFLNSLTKDENTLYFDKFHQTAQGKTSDAEFLLRKFIIWITTRFSFYNKRFKHVPSGAQPF